MTEFREPCVAVVVHHRDPEATERSLRSLLDNAPNLPVFVVTSLASAPTDESVVERFFRLAAPAWSQKRWGAHREERHGRATRGRAVDNGV